MLQQAATGNAAETQLFGEKLTNNLIRKYGVSALGAVKAGLSLGPTKDELLPDGTRVSTDASGQIYRTERPTYESKVRSDAINNIASMQVNMPKTTKIA